ncbi:MAG: OmpA family protein [Bacteroidota bacterium]
MAINLLDVLKDHLDHGITSRLSSLIGESEDKTKTAVGAALPSLLASFVHTASNRKGAERLTELLREQEYPSGLLNELKSVFSGGRRSEEVRISGHWLLYRLQGKQFDKMVDAVAASAQVAQQPAADLLCCLAPVVLTLINQQVRQHRLNTSGLMSLLGGQRPHVKAFLPAELSRLLELPDDAAPMNRRTGLGRETTVETTQALPASNLWPFGRSRSLLTWGLLLLGAAGSIYLLNHWEGNVLVKAEAAVNSVKEQIRAASEEVQIQQALQEVKFVDGSVGQRLSEQLLLDREESIELPFGQLRFAHEKANLDDRGLLEIDNLARVLHIFQGTSIAVESRTNELDDRAEQQKLSQQRADVVRNRLLEGGIAQERVTAIGHGEDSDKSGAIRQQTSVKTRQR